MTNGPSYYTPSPDAFRQQQRITEQNNQRRFNSKVEDFKNGRTVWRLLPPWSQSGFVSRLTNAWFKNKLKWTSIKEKAVPVIAEMWPQGGIEDPIMNAVMRIAQFADVDGLYPSSPRFLINALVLYHTPEGGTPVQMPDWHVPKILRIPKTANDWVLNRLSDSTRQPICDLYQGRWIETIRTGQGLETKYEHNIADQFPAAISEDVNLLNQIMDGLNDLDKFVGSIDQEAMSKQQSIARELLARYQISNAQQISSPTGASGAAPAPSTSASGTVGKPTAPSYPGAPPAPGQQQSAPPAPGQAPAAPPPGQVPAPGQVSSAPAAPPAAPPAGNVQPPAAPAAPAAPPSANPQPPAGAPQPPFPGSAVAAPAAAPTQTTDAGVPVPPPSTPTGGPVPSPAPVSNAPQFSGNTEGKKPCFAGFEGKMFLNSAECQVCPDETECRERDREKRPNAAPKSDTSPPAQASQSGGAQTSASRPPTDTPSAPPSMPGQAASGVSSESTPPSPTGASSPSEPEEPETPPCFGNKAKDEGAAEGHDCENCMYALPCEAYNAG